ncbi:MAG: hypothetical protein MUO76_02190 [Anaerolineaceae bacterium]|nr:hypothetical protein [Anaerolineaceae bacterium]
MEQITQTQLPKIKIPDYQQAWEIVIGQLRMEMSKALFDTYVLSLQALGYKGGVFTLNAFNSYTKEWVENRLESTITRQLEGLFNQPVTLKIEVPGRLLRLDFPSPELSSISPLPEDAVEAAHNKKTKSKDSTRKIALQRAYGSKRSAIIQPERSLIITQYFFSNWIPLIGHSALAVILAARSLCYWNPISGELRNEIETEMGELAQRASVSIRTVKTVLNHELVKRYFLRYITRRVMTPHGIRTAGITLQVRMDDPLTPEDQEKYNLSEDVYWYSPDFGDQENEEE